MRARLIHFLLRFLASIPLGGNRALAWLTGWCLYLLPNPVRRHSAINLRLCFPELSASARRSLLRQSLIETCKTAFEAGPLWFWPTERIQALMRETHNTELIDAVLASGRGAILATPHLGSWEISGHYCAWRWGITTLYRPPRLAALDSLIRQGRSLLGARLVRTDAKGVRQLYQTLSEGGVVGILPDQDPGRNGGCFAPFFGVSTNTMVLLGRLARKTGAAVFFGYSERLPGTQGYRLRFIPAPQGIDSADPQQATAALNQAVETLVRSCPQQYQWSYRRFRTRPPGAADVYK